ncbi:hypothetical protein GCM10023172_31600 [Hymenobacter ginsengisoli]|uniref:Uncharacterized protein n=1 Tax=Hymenobacter ginsengisoli TaxID=1051626 RepID=A0ABP8QM48_9BACT|nr:MULTISPECIES: hypothetical protein [unclassified Hymenobacter]MBO2031299.1 hypothetical protein [Hymenobacter sp. BT559]
MINSVLVAIAILFALSQPAAGQTPGITCSLSSDRTAYKLGEIPQFTIRIHNGSDSTVQFVKTLDASDIQWRYPYSYYEVNRVPSGPLGKTKDRMVRCGNMDGISLTDFVVVAPGQAFNPYENQSAVYTLSSVPSAAEFSKEGRYRIIYHYATNEPDFRKWLGDIAWAWFDPQTNQIYPSHQAQYQQLIALFAKVPKVNLVSNELTIDFN